VSVVSRGANLAAIRDRGIRLVSGTEEIVARVAAREDPAALGEQDLVIVSVKAPALESVAAGLRPLVGTHTRVVFGQNGMTWWYRVGHDRPPAPPLKVFDLAPAFVACVPPERILGALVYSANAMTEPGVVVNNSPGANRIVVGPILKVGGAEPGPIRAMLETTGIASPAVADIRRELWNKLLANMSGSVLALATGNQSSVCRRDEALGAVYLRLVREGLAIARAHGYPLDEVEPEAMLARLHDHKPSLLQDYEQRRPMELAEIVAAPLEFARTAGIGAPTLEVVAAIVTRLARDRGLL
jgi:2-dehydropantoate 2-reductase